ncbi:hypothetical protein PIIN_04656 [Serendipita indica DSM 11827]|uniref:Bulb-type lectin domain-containing protein n=1 Tax=Serendipita indica (strain DSM 11827) TaxID=1109443 RepID=G4THB9_SERID|nr:hypothetical protein PIIN_04656 [Serendipita indica DSM 11827]
MSRSIKPKEVQGNIDSSRSSSLAKPSTSKKNQVAHTTAAVLGVVADASEASDILAPLKAACRATKSILELMQAIESNQEEWVNLKGRLKEFMSAIEGQITLFETYPQRERLVEEAFSRPLIHYVEFLEKTHDAVAERIAKRSRSKFGFLKSFTKVKIDAGEIIRLNGSINDRHMQFMEALALFTASHVQIVKENVQVTKDTVEDTQVKVEITKVNVEATKAHVEKIVTGVDASAILQLPMVAFVASSVHRTCLQGTREAVLQTIRVWAHDDKSPEPIFWLCDIAGSGKSTVAMSAAQIWRTEGIFGGQFFFSLTSSEGSTTEKFWSTIARELAQRMPELKPHIARAVEQNPAIMRSPLQEQLQALIIDPLRHRQQRVILVIDAIDECKSGAQRKELLDTITVAAREAPNLKLFITSRPDPVIETALGPLSIKAELKDRLHGVNHPDNIDDIAAYVHQYLCDVLSLDKRQRLIIKASGLFIWASTACRMLTSEATFDTPEIIYERLISVDQTGDIDDVYDLVFQRADPKSHATMCSMLAILLAAFEPLTMGDLDDLFKHNGVHGNAKALVRNLGSVLLEDPATKLIQFRHPTFVEYLRRCCIPHNHRQILIDISNAHGQAASWCFKRFKSRSEGLKFNICQIESSFHLNREIPDLDARISKFISKGLRYASSHWLFHLAETGVDWRRRLEKELQDILQVSYALSWVEILSFIAGLPRAIAGLRAIAGHKELAEETRNRLKEIRQFLVAFSVPIQESAPHIYISALPFTPVRSIIHLEGLKKHKNTLSVTQGVEETYPGRPSMLRGHNNTVTVVSFSPDGSQIASGSCDNTLRLWDGQTGQPLGAHSEVMKIGSQPSHSPQMARELSLSLGSPLRGHEREVVAVAFSPDGSRVVSGSYDSTVRLWNADTGQQLGEPLQGHDSTVTVVAFSPDGSCIVSSSWDRTLRLWDSDTGHPLGEPLRGHRSAIRAVAFSPDGLTIVSGSSGITSGAWDYTIRQWDVKTGQPLGDPLQEDDTDDVRAIRFSSDGSEIVSASSKHKFRVWDAYTGQLLRKPLQGHEDSVYAVAISPDVSRIVSVFLDGVRLWDVESVLPPLRGHQNSVHAVNFSPDGSRIVSCSYDNTVRLWNATTGQPLGEPLQGHDSAVTAAVFSPDGSRILSGSWDNTIRIWDGETGRALGEPLRVDMAQINAVCFSPDGSRIVSASSQLYSGPSGHTIRLWDAETGQPQGEPLRGHQNSIKTVAFSPDGSQIVSGSSDCTIQLWDAYSGQPLGEPLRGHQGSINTVVFSPDGSRIVSGSDDKTIRFWDAETGLPLGDPLRGHKSGVVAVAFSPNGSRIVSGSPDGTVRLWDTETGQSLGEPFLGQTKGVWSVAFSPDGSRIASGSLDGTIRLWDAEIGV